MEKDAGNVFSTIQAVYISKSFFERVTSQSCDCDSMIIQTEGEYVLVNYVNHNGDGYIEWAETPYFETQDYPYEVDLQSKTFSFDRVSCSEDGWIDGMRFSADDVYLFIFGSEHNLIVTMSKYDLFEDVPTADLPENEAVLHIK